MLAAIRSKWGMLVDANLLDTRRVAPSPAGAAQLRSGALLDIVNPVAEARQDAGMDEQFPPAARLDVLDGKTIGLFWNGKPGGGVALARVKENLSKRFKNMSFVDTYGAFGPQATVSTSLSTVQDVGRELLAAGALRIALVRGRATEPYVVVGAGVASAQGDRPTLEIVRNLQLAFSTSPLLDELDTTARLQAGARFADGSG